MTVLSNQDHAWVFILLMVLAPPAAVWFYRRVPPSVGRGLRLLLATLRAAALMLLLAALVEPVVALTSVANERPVVAVLIDGSRSMSVTDGTAGATRGGEALDLVNDVLLERIARDAEVEAYVFSDALAPLDVGRDGIAERPAFDGDVTDIEGALSDLGERLAERSVGAVILATDGASNRGGSPSGPAGRLGAPVFVLGVGRSEPPADVALEDVRTNRISYVGETLPVAVTVASSGFEGNETVVELLEDGRVLDSRVVTLSGTGEESEVAFRVSPDEPGTHRYVVRVPAAPGEVVTGNNERVVVTTALRGRFRALVIGSRPDWDYAFLRRELEVDTNVELTALVPGVAGDEEAPRALDELLTYDLLILVDPDWANPPLPLDWVRAFVAERRGGLAVVGLPDGPGAEWPDVLPVSQIRPVGAGTERRVSLTLEGEASPLMRIVSGRSENVLLWNELPPVWTAPDSAFRVAQDARVLASADGVPVIVFGGRAGSGQVLAVLADGVWRWRMAGPDEDLFGRFVANASRWLTARGEIERVVVETDADVVPVGGRLVFRGQVYTSELRPEPGASVEVEVLRGEGAPVASLSLAPVRNGYEGGLSAPAPGRYTYRAVASVDGEVVGSDDGAFEVEPFALEDSDVRRRSSTLRRIADETGGAYVTPETLSDLPAELPLERVRRSRTREIELWDTPWLLTAFVGLLSVEWALRRRKGMP